MTENPNQPRKDDVVLGGQNLAPAGGMVLGGMEGLMRRLGVGNLGVIAPAVEQRVAALKDALKYGQKGWDLVIQALQDESEAMQRKAYLLLRENTQPEVREALREFNFYRFMSCLGTIKGGQNIAVSSDGETIAYLRTKEIKVVNLPKDELLYTIFKYPKAQEFFIISSDGQTVVRSIKATRNLIEVWHEGEYRHSLYGHEDYVGALAISPDRQMLATGSHDKNIKIWDFETGKVIYNFSNFLTWGTHTQAVSSLAFTPDGQTLISGSMDRTIKLWNLQTRDKPRTIKTIAGVLSIAISRDGKVLANTSWDRKIRLWNISPWEAIKTIDVQYGVNCLAFTPDGRILASGGSYENTIQLWNVGTGELVHTLTGHEELVSCLAFSWDGHTLISGSHDKTIKVWGVD